MGNKRLGILRNLGYKYTEMVEKYTFKNTHGNFGNSLKISAEALRRKGDNTAGAGKGRVTLE